MATPRLRISPSGPLAVDQSPFNEYAGNLYSTSKTATTEYVGKIGPTGSGDVATSLHLLVGPNASSPTNAVNLPVQSPEPVGFGVGVWEVDLELGVGFATAAPSAATYADLSFSAAFVTPLGAALGTPATHANSPLPRSALDTLGGSVTHSSQIKFFVEVTDAMIEANGNLPFAALDITMTRVTGSVNGTYTTTSGYLEVSKDTNVAVKRFR